MLNRRRSAAGYAARRRILIGVIVSALLPGCRGGDAVRTPDEPLLVLAAADLHDALPEIARRFEIETGVGTLLVFGSTGNLTTQIEQGAPGDLFLAANERFVDRLIAAGVALEGTRSVYAVGRLAVVLAPRTPPIERLEDLADPRITTFAIANPDHAPYGQAAREALAGSGLWTALERRLVMGENVAQALQFVRSGNADAGIVALGVVVGLPDTRYFLVDGALHQPLRQAGVVLRGSERPGAARQLLDFITSDKGQAVLRRYGFEEAPE